MVYFNVLFCAKYDNFDQLYVFFKYFWWFGRFMCHLYEIVNIEVYSTIFFVYNVCLHHFS